MKKFLVSLILFVGILVDTQHINADRLQNFIKLFHHDDQVLITKKMSLAEKEPILLNSQLLNVPLLNQMAKPQLKNGCEVTSLAMILNYAGVKVTKNQLANEINRVPIKDENNHMGNPNIGFVGNMETGPGYSVYNGPVFELAKKYVGKRAVNLTNRPFTDLLKKVSKGSPVWVITTNNFKPGAIFKKWDTLQGPVLITLSEHSVVITGYDDHYIYVNDPYGYKNRKVDRNSFIDAWEEMGKQAITIE